MRYRGVHYDTGVHYDPARLTRESFDLDAVAHDMEVIAGQLRCTAVRIVGDDVERLATTARLAARAGLTVFFNPWFIDRTPARLITELVDAARVAERLRADVAPDLVFVLGCELTLFVDGLIPGRGVYERVDWLVSLRDGRPPEPPIAEVRRRLGEVLAPAAAAARAEFDGRLTYAAGSWESVDWSLFDLVAVDYYRSTQTDEEYAAGLRELARHGKPVVVAEFGCCAYAGADELGGMGWMKLDEWADGGPRWLVDPPPTRDEDTQARYLTDQLDIFVAERLDGAFAFTFAAPYLSESPDPALDFDRSSYALVATAPAADPRSRAIPPWRPKKSFAALAGFYGRLDADG